MFAPVLNIVHSVHLWSDHPRYMLAPALNRAKRTFLNNLLCYTTIVAVSLTDRTSHAKTVLALQMQRHNLAQHMQEFTQMHMRYMAEFLRGLSLNGTTPKPLRTLGPSISSDDQGAAASLPACSGPRGAVNSCSNTASSQPSEEMHRLREMDGLLVKQDHQLR